jgi:hypothetical protein
MELMTFHRLDRSTKVLSGVTGAGVVVTIGAATVAYPGNEAGAGTNGWPVATITRTPDSLPASVVGR